MSKDSAILKVHEVGHDIASGLLGSAERNLDVLHLALQNDGNFKESAKQLFKRDNGEYNFGAIAGSLLTGYMGASAVGRIATGGGIYKDADGNTDLIGIPFI
jgi:hypothetical protein